MFPLGFKATIKRDKEGLILTLDNDPVLLDLEDDVGADRLTHPDELVIYDSQWVVRRPDDPLH